ncbi:hypothetical protein PCNPT3_07475 [Psychromonas sp. CNPT3]|uniref:hypothetical protein n=1 Tax=Psychromonas sp. CNPT3 TaxID=314282 RepID=UPI0002C1271A|nr:hypothetical protein [Psychromonas sp. CNPT3]AGH81433.1 hypothetical protein PCNPT3_07475 [Psychromonas sp. CNPT3]
MSQHLITQFIQPPAVFKSINGEKLVNHKMKKYKASKQENNSSPEDVAESVHLLKKINVKQETESSEQQSNAKDENKGSSVDVSV